MMRAMMSLYASCFSSVATSDLLRGLLYVLLQKDGKLKLVRHENRFRCSWKT